MAQLKGKAVDLDPRNKILGNKVFSAGHGK